ncbi:MAG: response regulator [bacterium]|nr:response regulator [bacterium]
MPRQVVIVEDTEGIRALYVALLRRWGCRIHEAGDGQSGLGLIREQRPDLVLLDIMLPALSGHDVLAVLRTNDDPQLRATPVIMTTALASRDMVAAIGALGVSGYLVKPITRDRFDREISRVLGAPGTGAAAPEIVVETFDGVPVVVLPWPPSTTFAVLGDAMKRTVETLAQAGHRRMIVDLTALHTLAPGAMRLVAEALTAARARRLRVAAVADEQTAASLQAIAETRAAYRATRDAAWTVVTGAAEEVLTSPAVQVG